MRGAARNSLNAFKVNSSGSPGPTPMPNSRPGIVAISARLQIIEDQDHTALTRRVVEPDYAVDCPEVHPAPRQGLLERLVFPITDQDDTRAGELSIPWACGCQPVPCRARRGG